MRWSFAPILMLATLGVAGCSTTLSDAQLKNVRHVAVISMLGNTFHGIHIGFLPGIRSGYNANVSDWHLDEDITDYLRNQLAADGFAVARLDLSPKRAEDFYSKPLVSNHYIRIEGYASPEPHYAELCRLAREQGDDMLLVVNRSRDPNALAVITPGYGLIDAHVFGRAFRNIYAEFVIRAFDTQSCSQRAVALPNPGDPKPDNTLPWKNSYEAFSAAEKARLKTAIEAHIRSEIAQGLRTMNLVSRTSSP